MDKELMYDFLALAEEFDDPIEALAMIVIHKAEDIKDNAQYGQLVRHLVQVYSHLPEEDQ